MRADGRVATAGSTQLRCNTYNTIRGESMCNHTAMQPGSQLARQTVGQLSGQLVMQQVSPCLSPATWSSSPLNAASSWRRANSSSFTERRQRTSGEACRGNQRPEAEWTWVRMAEGRSKGRKAPSSYSPRIGACQLPRRLTTSGSDWKLLSSFGKAGIRATLPAWC